VTRLIRAPLFVLSIVITSALLAPALAAADPLSEKKSEAQRIRQEVAAFDARLEAVIEQYNQATEDLKKVKGQIRKNSKALKIAELNLVAARTQLDARVVAMYKERPADMLDVLFAAGSLQEIASQLDLMRRVGEHDSALIDAVAAHKKEIKEKRTSLGRDRDEAGKLVADVAGKKDEIEDGLAERRSMLSGVEDEIRELERAEEEAARRAAEAAAAQVAESSSSSGDTSSSGSTASGTTPTQRPIIPSGGGGRPQIPAIAARYLGTPYRYGGTSPQTGFDCSGFVQYVFAQAGISLPRTSMTQQQIGTRVSMNALQPGDLVFRGYPAYHVGIYVGGGQAIHSPRTGYTVCYQSISYWTSAVRP